MLTWILWIVSIVLVVIALANLLELGVALFIVLAVLPFALVLLFVREQHLRYLRQCVEHYLHLTKR